MPPSSDGVGSPPPLDSDAGTFTDASPPPAPPACDAPSPGTCLRAAPRQQQRGARVAPPRV
eukprot:gene7675-9768_t